MSSPSANLPIERVAVLGAGDIGWQIAIQCATAGCHVSIYDCDAARLEITEEKVHGCITCLHPQWKSTVDLAHTVFTGIVRQVSLDRALDGAQLIVESVTEQTEIKRQLLAEAEALCPTSAILATNSSVILPSTLSQSLQHPERLAALHFALGSSIVEIMPHAGTDPTVLATLKSFGEHLADVAVVCHKEHAGHILNSLTMALNSAALTLLQRGVASVEDIDRAWMKATNSNIGPFGSLDGVGLDAAWRITSLMGHLTQDRQLTANAKLLKELVDRGDFGRKSGRGFYSYPNPQFRDAEFLASRMQRAPVVESAERPHTASQSPSPLPKWDEDSSAVPPAVSGGAVTDSSNSNGRHGDARAMRRFGMRLHPQENHSPVDAPWSDGQVAIWGSNECATLLAQEFQQRRITTLNLPEDLPSEQIEHRLREGWRRQPVLHLILAGTWSRDAQSALESPAAWETRWDHGVVGTLLASQKWLQLIVEQKRLKDATLAAATRLGGDFGLSGGPGAIEGGAVTGLLKSMQLEYPTLRRIKVVDASPTEPHRNVCDLLLAELKQTDPEVEVACIRGRRHVLRAAPLESFPTRPRPIQTGGVWVVTGGGRGVTGEAAFELARRFDLRMHLLGQTAAPEPSHQRESQTVSHARSDAVSPTEGVGTAGPLSEKQMEIAAMLERYRSAGLDVEYHSCDVADETAVADVLDRIRQQDGPVRGIIHGAGADAGMPFREITRETMRRVLDGKLRGAQHLMKHTRADPLELFVGFGSTSGRFGAVCNADYAAANDMLAKMIDRFATLRPSCRGLTFHWTAWDDVGMCIRPKSRLAIQLMGVRMMSAKEGAAHFVEAIESTAPDREVVICDHPGGVHSTHPALSHLGEMLP